MDRIGQDEGLAPPLPFENGPNEEEQRGRDSQSWPSRIVVRPSGLGDGTRGDPSCPILTILSKEAPQSRPLLLHWELLRQDGQD